MSNRQHPADTQLTDLYEVACPSCGGHDIERLAKVTITDSVALTKCYVYRNGQVDFSTCTPGLTNVDVIQHDYHWAGMHRFVCADCGKSSKFDDTFIRRKSRSA